MNYFRCTVGGSGKGNTVTVTCASEFAGQTITLAKTGKTYTKTCPSSSPYTVTFYGVENGTYTVSATVSGQTYSETVVVQDISCVLNYGFSWKIWVDTASQLDSSDYDSLDEVLADEEALRELFLEHACVDYMAESTASNEDLETIINDDYCAKWINNSDYALDTLYANEVIADLMDTADKYFYGEWVITDDTTTPPTWGPKGAVPKMTSATAPYGSVIGTSAYGSGNQNFKAFDNDDTTNCSASSNVTTANVGYKFTNPINVKKFSLKIMNTSGIIADTDTLKISYSDDGTNFTDISETYTYEVSDLGTTKEYTFTNDYGYHLYWKFTRTLVTAKPIIATTLQFYGRELKVSVPVMTSDTAPFGTANGTSIYANSVSSYDYFHAFRGLALTSSNRGWLPTVADSQNKGKVYYHFTTPIKVKAARLCYVQSSSANPPTGHFVGSHDGITWTAISETKTATTSMTIYNYEMLDNADAYEYVGFELTQEWNSAASGLYGLAMEIYGLDYSEKEFEAGTTKKWLYDHGVELETLDTSGTVTKGDNEIKLSAANAEATKTLDLTNFSLLRCIVGANMSGTTQLKAATTATANLTAGNAPNNNSLNVSAINQSLATGVKMTANGVCDIEELWLEP